MLWTAKRLSSAVDAPESRVVRPFITSGAAIPTLLIFMLCQNATTRGIAVPVEK
ncbi:MAG: hypothetical protein ACYS9X_20110 [Planctomycetota bacterium]